MPSSHPRLHGIWLPLVSPFLGGELDESSFRRLVRHYSGRVDGFVLGATTGEGMALSHEELRLTMQWTREELDAARETTPILLGISGAITSAAVAALQATERWPVDGFLVTCPYYVRPSQEGLRQHFEAIADSTDKAIVVYNIPYRTGVNLENDTLLRVAERTNIVGVKDCCANPAQTRDLIERRPTGFSVLAGEDASLDVSFRDGAEGGIVASAHFNPEGFRQFRALVAQGRRDDADALWSDLAPLTVLLFSEPNPAPIKHCLWQMGLIASPELRLPMTPVSSQLALRLDAASARFGALKTV
jgi:4-hydroxy-tetrahydrodipicolinate synthase